MGKENTAMSILNNAPSAALYPDSDGEPMADNTKQADEMVLLKTTFDDLFADRDDVFVAMDLLWYPVQGHSEARAAPDIMVVFGRPKGYRGSYKQWEEREIAPQVVFEILSPGNRSSEMGRKFEFYQRHGVEEYYIYNPDDFDLSGWHWVAEENRLRLIDPIDGWISPRLGIRFDAPADREMIIYRPDGTPFRSPLEVRRELERAEAEKHRAEAERDRLADKLRELGVDPDALR
jgi:Uma2 family endonuclease